MRNVILLAVVLVIGMAAFTLLAIVFGPVLLAIESVSNNLFELTSNAATWFFVEHWWLALLIVAVLWIWQLIKERRENRQSSNGFDQ